MRELLEEVIGNALRSARDEKPQPYSRAEVMEILHCKETSLWTLQQNGTLHPIKIGGKVLFNRAEVDALLQNRIVKKGGAL